MVSLCAACPNNDWQKMQELFLAYKDAGLKPPTHIWCKATDRPEDPHYNNCPYKGDDHA